MHPQILFLIKKYSPSFINPRRPIFTTMTDCLIERQDGLILPQNGNLSKKASGQIAQESKLRKDSG